MATLIPCLAGLLCGRLRHSHLQNTYLQEPGLIRSLVMEEYEDHLFWQETLMQMDQLKAELAEPKRGFSPAYLVVDAQCGTGGPDEAIAPLRPLRSLSPSQRELLGERLAGIYVAQFGLEQRKRQLEEADSEFRSALQDFIAANDGESLARPLPPMLCPSALKEFFAPSGDEESFNLRLEKASRKLFEVLGSLPGGIFLPGLHK